MSSAAHKAVVQRRRRVASANTSAAGWGKVENQQFGLGWRRADSGATKPFEPNPVGMPLKNVAAVACGYGQGMGLQADGHVQVWGLNNSNSLPWNVGPERAWTGFWQYRAPIGSLALSPPIPVAENNSLGGQKTLELEGKTKAQIEAQERALEFAPRAEDGRKGVVGQVVYIAGHVAIHEGVTYISLVENCGIKPGTPAAVGVWSSEVEQVPQFLHEKEDGSKTWTPIAFNLGLPILSPQLKGVTAISAIGARGGAVLSDGSIRMWGRVTGISAGGVGFNASYGPEPRPLKAPTKKLNPFHGRLVAGSEYIDQLENIGEQHHNLGKSEGITCTYGKAKRPESEILLPEGVTGVLPAGTKIVEAETEEVLDGEGHKFNPERRRITRIKLTQKAEANWGPKGQLFVKKPTRHQPFWPVTEGPVQSAGFPMKPTLPEGVKCTAIACGTNGGTYPFTIALTDTGRVLAWGSHVQGQMGSGVTAGKEKIQFLPEYVKGLGGEGLLENIVAVAVGETFCLALDSSHRIWIWGSLLRGLGGLKNDEEANRTSTTPIILEGVPTAEGERPVAIAGMEGTGLALLEDGTLMAWGTNGKGECGIGSVGGQENSKNWKGSTAYLVGEKVYDRGGNFTNAAATSAVSSLNATLTTALTTGGPVTTLKVTALGGAIPNGSVITLVGGGGTQRQQFTLTAEAKAAATSISVASLTPNFAYGVGAGVESTHPAEDAAHWTRTSTPTQPVPGRVAGLSGVTGVAAGRSHAMAWTVGGAVFTWGSNEFGQIGNGQFGRGKTAATPFPVPLEGKRVVGGDCGEFDTIVLLEGSSTIFTPLVVKFLPQGEVAGEQNVHVRFEMHSTRGILGWQLEYKRQPAWWEEAEVADRLEEIKEELEEEPEAEERLELEEEEEELLAIQNEKKGTRITILPTEISPGVLRYDWTPPGPLTPNIGYILGIGRPGDEPANWRETSTATNGTFLSPYVF